MSPVTDLPSPGGTLLTEQMAVRVGGAGANAALASVEAGLDVRLIGCIGDDQLGGWMREQLARAGLADELVVVAGETSGLTVVLESPARDRTFLTYLGVNARWEPAMIPDDALTCDNLLLCDYFVAPRLRGDAARAAAGHRRARVAPARSSTPPGIPTASPGRPAPRCASCSRPSMCSCPTRSKRAHSRIGPGTPAEAARALQAVSGGWVVVKRGPSGCFAVGPDGTEIAVPAPAVDVADTTGAGDAFNAGLVHALARGAGWREALAQATQFATTIISRPSDDRYRIAR